MTLMAEAFFKEESETEESFASHSHCIPSILWHYKPILTSSLHTFNKFLSNQMHQTR